MIETMTKYTGNLGLKRRRKFKMYKHNFSWFWGDNPRQTIKCLVADCDRWNFIEAGRKRQKLGQWGYADVTRPFADDLRFYRKVRERGTKSNV